MKHKVYSMLLSIVFLLFISIVPGQAAPLESMIRVGILSNQQKIVVSADTEFKIMSKDTGKLIALFPIGKEARISAQGKKLFLNDKEVAANKITIIKSTNNDKSFLEVDQKQYRGSFEIHITQGKTGLTVVNNLPIEQYLYGVIAREMSPDWPLEAVKAQTVAARSYAIHSLKKHQKDDYDVCNTTDCQVYGGRESEHPRVLKAVDDTAGKVIFFQGKVIPAYFHSSSGGYTENSENVWGTSLPYLRGVVDYDQKSPQFKWEKTLTKSELEQALGKGGYSIGRITAIELPPLTPAPMTGAARGVSGRVKVVKFIGTSGTVEVNGEKVRKLLDLKSTLFDISVLSPALKQGSSKNKTHSILVGEKILITGFGWGHGLGLSQWGAKGMAEKGPQGDSTYYEKILKHYYQGTTIKKVF